MLLLWEIIAVLVLIGLGAFFSGSETGVYRLSRFRLRLGVEQKRPLYKLLSNTMSDPHGLVFSILIGNNLVNYLATSTVTVLLLKTDTSRYAAFYATVIMTPVLFTFSEVIPKNVYYYRSDKLMPRFAPVLWFFHKAFTLSGAVGLLKLISRPFTLLFGASTDASTAITASRTGQIRQIIRETHEEGLLSTVQNDLINRLFKIPEITIGSVMTPAAKIEMIDVNSDRRAVLSKMRDCAYTNIPVYEHRKSNIIGYIRIYDALAANGDFENLRKFMMPVKSFPAMMPVIEAINNMRKQNLKIVLVSFDTVRRGQGHARSLGIVTMKDLVEELTGELAQW